MWFCVVNTPATLVTVNVARFLRMARQSALQNHKVFCIRNFLKMFHFYITGIMDCGMHDMELYNNIFTCTINNNINNSFQCFSVGKCDITTTVSGNISTGF